MPTDLTIVLWQLTAYVDQMGAEYLDPNTLPERKKDLHGQLHDLYKLMKVVEHDFS